MMGLPYKGNEGIYLIVVSALLPGFWAGDDLLRVCHCRWWFCGTLTSIEIPLGITDLGKAHLHRTWMSNTMVRRDGLCSDLTNSWPLTAKWSLADNKHHNRTDRILPGLKEIVYVKYSANTFNKYLFISKSSIISTCHFPRQTGVGKMRLSPAKRQECVHVSSTSPCSEFGVLIL